MLQLLIIVFLVCQVFAQQETVTVTFEEYPKALKNPLKGFRGNGPFETTNRIYIDWDEIEDRNSDGIDKIRNWWNNEVRNYPDNNLKAIPRVQLQDHRGSYWPSDINNGDYSSEGFKSRLRRLIRRLGEVWDNDPRVAFIQMGMIGKWGEHHSPSLTDDMQQLLGEEFSAAFKNKKVMQRYTKDFDNFEFGLYWDSFAHPQDERDADGLDAWGDRWHTQVMGGEIAFNWGNVTSALGGSQSETLREPKYRNRFINYIRRTHTHQLGSMRSYNSGDQNTEEGADLVQKAFGYRFILKEATFPKKIEKGNSFMVSFKVQNMGSAPFYYLWPVELSLLKSDTHEPVWKDIFRATDIREWLPGDKWKYEKEHPEILGTGYEIPAKVYAESWRFTVPANVPGGEYILAVAILDPGGGEPAVRFAVKNYFEHGRHPLGKVGVDTDISSYSVDAGEYSDIQSDRLKYNTNTVKYDLVSTQIPINFRGNRAPDVFRFDGRQQEFQEGDRLYSLDGKRHSFLPLESGGKKPGLAPGLLWIRNTQPEEKNR